MALGLHVAKRLKADQREQFALLYEETQAEMQQLCQLEQIGMESFTDDAMLAAKALLQRAIRHIGRLADGLMRSLRDMAQQTFNRKDALLKIWNERLRHQLQNVDQTKFGAHRLNIVDQVMLEKRITAVSKLHFILDNVERICDAPIQGDSDEWRTNEFNAAYHAMQDIGFDTHRYNLVKQTTASYDDAAYQAALKDHGYTLDSLGRLIAQVQTLAKYANASYAEKLSGRFVEYSEGLIKYEKALRENDDLDEADKQTRLRQVQIKAARLWWATHFIKAQFHIMRDIADDVLRLCKIAERYLRSEESSATESLFDLPESTQAETSGVNENDSRHLTEMLEEISELQTELLAVAKQYQSHPTYGMEHMEWLALEGLTDTFSSIGKRIRNKVENFIYHFGKAIRDLGHDDRVVEDTLTLAREWDQRIRPYLQNLDKDEFADTLVHKWVVDYPWVQQLLHSMQRVAPLAHNIKTVVLQPMDLKKIQFPREITTAIDELKKCGIVYKPSRNRGEYLADYDNYNDHIVRNLTLEHLGYTPQCLDGLLKTCQTICKETILRDLDKVFIQINRTAQELNIEGRALEHQYKGKSHAEIGQIQELYASRWGWFSTMVSLTYASMYYMPKTIVYSSFRVFDLTEDMVRVKK